MKCLLLLLDIACRMSHDLLEIIDIYSESKQRNRNAAGPVDNRSTDAEGKDICCEKGKKVRGSRVRSNDERWKERRDAVPKASCRPSESARYLPNGFTSWQTPCPCVPLCADQYMGTYLFLVKSLSSGLFNIFVLF